MNTKNMWQQATITYDNETNFKELRKIYGTFILNDMVRIHSCDLPRIDVLARSKFSAKLAGLPRFTNGKQLMDIGRMLNATSWIIPRARSNYQNLQHAFFYFESADDVEAALSNNNLTIDKKHVTWTKTNAKLCAICSAPNHKVNDCPRKRRTPSDQNMQQLYQKFQPAQYNNYKAPSRPSRGAVNPNISFAHITKGQNSDNIPNTLNKSNDNKRTYDNRQRNTPKPINTTAPPPDS